MKKPKDVSAKLWEELDKYNQKKWVNIFKSIKSEMSNIPEGKDRDGVIAHNIAFLMIWDDFAKY